jgi:adenylosuccinate lyase
MNLMMPGNPRYQPKSLVPYFGYDNTMRGVGEVEIATMQVLGEIEVIPSHEIALLTP